MEKIWLKQYPSGVPDSINPDIYASLSDLFASTVEGFPDRPAVSNMGTRLTYRELDLKADQLAAFLQKSFGLKKGDRFAIMMPNVIQYFVAIFAAFKAGLVVVNVNPLYTKRELAHQMKDAGVKAILVLENFAATVAAAVEDYPIPHIMISSLGDEFFGPKRWIFNFIVKRVKKLVPAYHLDNVTTYRAAMKKGAQLKFERVLLNGDDIAFLQYTGGTTGVPKGAVLTHRNMVGNAEQAYAWVSPFLERGKEAIITALPLYHIFSLLANCLVFTRAASENILITNPRDIKRFVKEIKRQPFSGMTGVNTLFNALVNDPDFASVDFSKMKVTLGGGMSVHKSVADKWKEITGCPICEAYGLTETSPAVTINPLTVQDYNASIGLPIPSTEIKILSDNGDELPVGESGELCVRGPQVMREYWHRPDETAKVLDQEGWLKTGDIAKVDNNGFIYIVDRKKDMVDVSGFNVFPNEVEEIISQHPGVLEVAVIGVPSETTGEALKAYIVRKDPELTERDIKTFCRQYLTPYKVPKLYEFRDELPKSNVGKILRRALREEIVEH